LRQAPEVFSESKMNHKADIYALGVIINEAIARRPPWDYDTPFQVRVASIYHCFVISAQATEKKRGFYRHAAEWRNKMP
jgi:serine/threonine protein kinase